MKKQYKKALAAVLAVSLAWNLIPNIPYAHASQTSHYIVDDIETLPDDILYQQVEFGTKKKDLELPNKLEMLVRPDDEEDWDVEYIETATSSNADKATPSDAEKADEDEDETATPSTATSSNAEDTDGDWRMVRVEWVLNERFSEAAEYDGEQPGIYVFDAEFANDRYSVGDALLPTIEVEVLEEVQEQPVQRAPLAIQEQAVGGMATITAFAELSDEVKAQELAIGASETEITLPNTLGVILALQTEDSVDGGTGDEINVGLTGIEWKIDEEKSSTAEFSSDESASGNKYVYVPVLPETTELKNDNGEMQVYTLALDTNLELPEITVTIAWVADKYGTPMDGGITGDCEWKVYGTNNNHTADLLVVSGEGRTGSYKGYDRPWESYKDTITSLIVEDGVEYIDQMAFWSMTALENIKLAGSVQGMDYMAFCLCGSLKRLVLPEGLTYIGAVAFSGCENLTYAELPDTLDKIDNWAFDGCVSLETLIIPKNVASIGTEVFDEGTTVYNLSEAELTSDMLGGAKEGNVYKITLSDGSGEEQIQKVLTSEIAAGTRYEGTEYNAASYFADGDGNAWFVLDEESGFYSEVTAENEAEVLSANPVLYKAKTMSWNGINAAAEYTGKQDASYTLTVTDTVSGSVLEEGVHYTQQITSENGTGADGNPTSDGSQLGTVTVTITGIPENGYAGTREVTFKVTPAVRVTLEDGTETEYLKISEAFASVHEGQTATITLFHDVEVESGKSITVSGTIELVGGDYTISGTRSYYRKGSATGLFHISSGASLTVQSGTIRNVVSVDNAYNSSYCITVDGGALTVNGGSIMALHEGSQMTMGIYATGGTVEIHGGSVYAEDLSPDIWGVGYGIAVYGGTIVISEGRIEGNACGLYVAEGTASLSGGTFAGLDSRVYALDSSVGAVGTLLVNGYVYYDGEEAEGTPAYGVNSTETYLPAGPFTVGLCMEHNYGDCSDTGTGVHTYVCGYCGKENAESHNWGGWSNDEASGKHIHICTDCGATENGDHNWDSSGNCTDCTAQAPVSVSRDGGRTANYYSSIEEAWAAAKELSNGDTQTTLTLLQNVTVSATLTVESGDDIILTSAEGTEYSLSGDVYNRESGLINVSGGTFMLQGGIIENGENGTNAVAVNGGLFILDGGTAVARASGESGVCVYNGGAADLRSGSASGYNGAAIVDGGSATISGGTYTGTSAAILLRNVDSTLKSILEQDMAYYSGSDIIAENLITDLTGRSLTGTVTVGKCEHSYSVWTANEDGKTHSGTCVVCGDSISADHSWGENGKCTAEGCTAQAVASVTVNDGKPAYYPTIEEAWQAAKNMTGTATVTLLADAVVTSSLTVEDSEEIIFTGKSADGVVHTLSSDMLGYQGVIAVNGGSLILLDGNIKPCSMGYGLNVKGGSFIMKDGSIVGSYWALVAEAGSVTIEGGTIDAGRGCGLMVYKDAPVTVTLSGGTYIGGSGGNYAVGGSGSVGAYLANGYAYKQGDTWVNDTTVTELTGTVTVEEAPLQNVSISPATTTITSGDTAPTLTATAVQPEGSTNNVTYQWYLDGEEIAGTTGETYTPDKLDVGEYSYTCTATVDGYSLPGTAAIVTVNRASIENATVTLTGTSFEYLGGTLEIGVQSVMLNGVKLTWGTDYIYSGSTGEAAKTYMVTVEGKGNYTGTATAEWEIYPRELTVGGWTIEKVYDGTADIALDSTEFQLNFGYPWYGQDDDVKLDASGVTAQFSDAAAGEEKVITYTGEFTLTGGDADNYILKKQPAFLTGTITQRKITVTPDEGQKRGYGQAMPVLTYTITGDGMAEGESLTGALACDTGDGAVGKYEITQGTLTATENYDLTFTDGVMFEITAVEDVISVDVTWGAMEFTYTDGAWNPETHTYGDGGWTATDDRDQITVTNKGNTNVTVSYLYVQTNEEVFGSFMEMGEDGESRKLLDTSNPIALPAGETKTTWLSLLGHPGDNFIGTHELGTVTVTIGSGTTKNDPIGGGE